MNAIEGSSHRRKQLPFVIVTVLYWISLYTYVPILSPYLDSLGASFAFTGIVLGSYGFTQIILRLPLGIVSDRQKKRKPYIILGMASAALSCLLFALGDHLGWTLAARAVSGIAASTWVAFTVLYASYFDKNDATKAMGTISFMTVTGQCIGMLLSGWLAEQFGWSSTFWVGAAAGIAGLIGAYFISEPKSGVHRDPILAKDLTAVMVEPVLIKVSILSILAHCVLFITMFGFTPSYAVELGASRSDLSLLSFAFMVPHAAASLLAGRWFAPRFGAWTVVGFGFVVSTLCTALIPLISGFGMLVVTQAFNGFAQGLHLPLLLGLAIQMVDQHKRATAMGFYQSVYALGMFGGPFLAGWLNEAFQLQGGFYFGGLCGLLAAALTLVWSAKAKRTQQMKPAGRTIGG